jgi:hypothetical protein
MPLSFTPLLRLKRGHACGQWHSSRVSTTLTSCTHEFHQHPKGAVGDHDAAAVAAACAHPTRWVRAGLRLNPPGAVNDFVLTSAFDLRSMGWGRGGRRRVHCGRLDMGTCHRTVTRGHLYA